MYLFLYLMFAIMFTILSLNYVRLIIKQKRERNTINWSFVFFGVTQALVAAFDFYMFHMGK